MKTNCDVKPRTFVDSQQAAMAHVPSQICDSSPYPYRRVVVGWSPIYHSPVATSVSLRIIGWTHPTTS